MAALFCKVHSPHLEGFLMEAWCAAEGTQAALERLSKPGWAAEPDLAAA